MNTVEFQGSFSLAADGFAEQLKRVLFRIELGALAVLLLLVNSPLVTRTGFEALIFSPRAVADGGWWRVFTHPFVHVSWYHLLLDGSAFLMLYAELRRWTLWGRGAAIVASGAGSLLAALTSPGIATTGFCGLSGIAHGLMAIVAIEMIGGAERRQRRLGWFTLVTVCVKALLETLTGELVLSRLHFGLIGSPVAACHLGGVLGGLLVAVLAGRLRACHRGEMTLIRVDHEPHPAAWPCARSLRVGSFRFRGRTTACVHRDRRGRRSR